MSNKTKAILLTIAVMLGIIGIITLLITAPMPTLWLLIAILGVGIVLCIGWYIYDTIKDWLDKKPRSHGRGSTNSY